MQNITQLISDIRDLINKPRKKHLLLKDSTTWNMLCSSLDVIEDTDYCLEAFLTTDIDPLDDSNKYMYVYGTLQALFVQQDAVEHLTEPLKIPYPLNENSNEKQQLDEIREIRNDSVGHPTKRGGGIRRAFNFTSRITINNQGFELGTTYADGRPNCSKDVNIPNLIATQRRILIGVLDSLIKPLRKEEMEHRREFADKKLADAFHPSLNYLLRKIREAVGPSGDARLGGINVGYILKCIGEFKTKLAEREILEASEVLTYNLELVDYPLQELRKYFFNPDETHINERDASIFAYFAEKQTQKLLEMAKELDEEYSQ